MCARCAQMLQSMRQLEFYNNASARAHSQIIVAANVLPYTKKFEDSGGGQIWYHKKSMNCHPAIHASDIERILVQWFLLQYCGSTAIFGKDITLPLSPSSRPDAAEEDGTRAFPEGLRRKSAMPSPSGSSWLPSQARCRQGRLRSSP